VELMGGEISVDSRYGEGSTFTFTVEVGVAAGGRRHEVPVSIDPSRIRILIVEDNAVARAVLHDSLRGLRFTDVEAVADGYAAMARFRDAQTRGEPFDVILMDWRMPGLDGLATAQQLRALARPRPMPAVIMMTAHARADLAGKARDAGIFKVLFKPVNVSTLVDGIAEALDTGSGSRAITRAPAAAAETPRPRLRGLRVLLVEDNEINQQIALEILEDVGVIVEIAASGTAALTWLRTASPPPDAVLMDLQMPELDGYETTRWMRADDRFKDIPVIAMTAHATADERRRCLAAGMVDHVPKPIEVRQLLDALDRWTGGEDGDGPASGPVDSPPVASHPLDAGPEVADLDLEAARARLGLPMEILQRAVDRFADTYRLAPATLADLLASGLPKEAERYAHTIVGLSGTIGAAALSSAARAIEDALRRSEVPPAADLETFARAHQAVFVAIDGAPAPTVPAATGATVDPSRLADLLLEMDRGLASSRLAVRSRIHELRSLCGPHATADLERLATSLAGLDYPAGRAILRIIAAAHHVDMDGGGG